jgi:hypothetical protein
MMTPTTSQRIEPAQAAAMAQLVELEAQWEALTLAETRGELGLNISHLTAKQKAFDAYHAKVVAYNGRFKPAYEAERLVNTPVRLAMWCRKMQDLYHQVEADDRVRCPVHLLAKAYRCADRIGIRLNREPVSRSTPAADITTAIDNLATVAKWCQELVPAPVPARI